MCVYITIKRLAKLGRSVDFNKMNERANFFNIHNKVKTLAQNKKLLMIDKIKVKKFSKIIPDGIGLK